MVVVEHGDGEEDDNTVCEDNNGKITMTKITMMRITMMKITMVNLQTTSQFNEANFK